MKKSIIPLTIILPTIASILILLQIITQSEGMSCQIEVEKLYQEKQENIYWENTNMDMFKFLELILFINNKTEISLEGTLGYIPATPESNLTGKFFDRASEYQKEVFQNGEDIIKKQKECRALFTRATYFVVGALILSFIILIKGFYSLKKK